jgi:hypothetical protein
MLRNVLVGVIVLAGSMMAQVGQTRTIRELQEVPMDSLALMESLQSTARTSLDDTPYAIRNDTVRVTGIVLVRPRVLTYTLARYNIFIQDTTTGAVWAGLNVLTNDTSAAAQTTGITALDSGDVVTVTGRALEFGSQPNSLTEMYIYNASGTAAFTSPVAIDVHASFARPAPLELTVDSFSIGTTPRITSGEKYEGMYVIIRNVTVNSINVSNGDFTFVDANGNQMRMYDGSGWYTLRGHKISGSRYSPPPVGTKLAYIRGVILPQARSGTAGEYTIMPLYPGPREQTGSTYPGDILIDKFAPSITEVTKSPGVPLSSTPVSVSFRAKDLNTNSDVDSAFVYYRGASSGPFTSVKLTLAVGDSLYRGVIPTFPNNSLVSWFAGAFSGGQFGMFPDSTAPYFYPIRDAGLTIYDLQYTPYTNSNGPFTNDTVTVAGTIYADTSDITEVSSGRPRLWMTQGIGAWRGIPIYGTTAAVGIDTLMKGDSIIATGIVRETNSRTILQVLSRTLAARGMSIHDPNSISISGSGSVSYELGNPPTNGNRTFEQWEGTLVRVTNVYVVNRNADNPTGGASNNFGEYMVSSTNLPSSNSRFGIRVDDNGHNLYYADTSSAYPIATAGNPWASNTRPANGILIPLGSKIASLTAVFDYSFSFYKLQPRTNADFGTITGVVEQVSEVPGGYALEQNYPNPFNPSSTISYTIPAAAKVQLSVYNVLGQQVATLVDSDQAAGSYTVTFDASRLSTGTYFYTLRVGDFMSTRKMTLIK